MFLKYQKLIVNKPLSSIEMKVYYLADYIGYSKYSNPYPITFIICQELDTDIIYHIEASDIIGIIDKVDNYKNNT
jgi:hypothetical protein